MRRGRNRPVGRSGGNMTSRTLEEYINDIPRELALSASAGVSFVPEQRAESERQEYAAALTRDYEELRKHAEISGTIELLEAEFESYRQQYRKLYLAWLSSRSRIVSWMISGRSNFPFRRMEKRNEIERKRLERLNEF